MVPALGRIMTGLPRASAWVAVRHDARAVAQLQGRRLGTDEAGKTGARALATGVSGGLRDDLMRQGEIGGLAPHSVQVSV